MQNQSLVKPAFVTTLFPVHHQYLFLSTKSGFIVELNTIKNTLIICSVASYNYITILGKVIDSAIYS